MKPQMLLSAALFSTLLGLQPALVAAADKPDWRSWPLGQRLTLNVSAYRPDINTFTELNDPDNAIQGSIEFEQDLNLEDSKTVGTAGLKWKISKRNSLQFDYFKLDRSGQGNSQVEVTIRPDGLPPVTFPVATELQAYIDVEAYSLSYAYSLLFDEKKEWSLGLGVSLQDFALGIQSADFPQQAAATDVTAPLPTLNTKFSYALTDKWLLDLGLGWLDVDVDLGGSGSYEGSILTWSAGLRWQAFSNLGFELAYTSFDLDVDIEDDDLNGNVEYDYKGPRLGVNLYF